MVEHHGNLKALIEAWGLFEPQNDSQQEDGSPDTYEYSSPPSKIALTSRSVRFTVEEGAGLQPGGVGVGEGS